MLCYSWKYKKFELLVSRLLKFYFVSKKYLYKNKIKIELDF